MTTKEFRRIGNEKIKRNSKKIMVVAAIFSIINLLMNYIPLAGGLAMLVIGPVLTFGFYKAIVLLMEGKDVKTFDYFKLGFDNFSKVWQLIWEVLKKTWVPLLIIIIGIFIIFGGVVASAVWSIGSMGLPSEGLSNTASDVFGIVTILAMLIGLLAIIGGSIWYFIKSLRYTLVNFYLIKNPDLSAKQIMEMNGKDIQGNVGNVAKIMFYYLLINMGITFAMSLLAGILAFIITYVGLSLSISEALLELITNLISYGISFIMTVLVGVFITPKMVASYNELHNYISNNNANNMTNNFNNYQNNNYQNINYSNNNYPNNNFQNNSYQNNNYPNNNNGDSINY